MSRYITILLLILSSCLSTSGAVVDQEDALTVNEHHAMDEFDLASLLTAHTPKQDTILQEALILLDSMKLSPSCNRIAVSELVSSCQSIGGRAEKPDKDIYLTLEHVRSLYAARLAICELKEAKATIPDACLPLMIAPPHRRGILGFSLGEKLRFSSPELIQKSRLESCLRSLETRPQWWTSYSNSRQNAVVICQAARSEIEKEELVKLHRAIVDSTRKLNRGLQEALKTATADAARQKAFMQAVEGMRSRLTQEMGETESRFSQTIEKALHSMGTYINSVKESFGPAVEIMHQRATNLEDRIQTATAGADELISVLRAMHEEISARNTESAIAQQRDVEASRELALSLQTSLRALGQDDLQRLVQTVQGFDASLRLPGLETALQESQERAEQLHQVQLQQYEALKETSRLHEQSQIRMNGTLANLDRAAVAAANLLMTIDRTGSRYRLDLALKMLLDLVWPIFSAMG
ncbi:putative nuclear membrane fusion protein Kar5 [Aspergillus homomorphus CBS 101889]|uniref:Nuclear membrane fusion protein Kar5 n=1 Tax=Aspergillus homomorphus (strain CBS 101889) TaxID=1450537 RepID=A0A395IDW5_ASPHC|nr:hypothetical protein BO97DRAFT_419596 [Aspergillus homomorphus CBS 101889]RAL17353.1 hypothetical protein BO97DRAFT_419596 [Aspergillus homomorphus CBS 101889]